MDIKKDYEKYVKKYNLPSYEDLDSEFELLYFGNLIEVSYILRFIRRRINDRLSYFTGALQGFLQPNPGSPISLEESNFLDEDDKKKVLFLIKALMNLERKSTLLDLNFDEKKDAEFIKESTKKWFELKKEVYDLLSKIKKGWESSVKDDSKETFFG